MNVRLQSESFLPVLFLLFSLAASAQVDEHMKFKMFCSALSNQSTAPNYVVVTVRNLNTGEIKEVCTEAPFINGAMGREIGDWSIQCKDYKARYFELSKDSALSNISFNLYTQSELERFEKSIHVANIVEQVKSGKLNGKTFEGSKKEQVMFAHLMFNYGVMMTRGCIAGNICKLSYFK